MSQNKNLASTNACITTLWYDFLLHNLYDSLKGLEYRHMSAIYCSSTYCKTPLLFVKLHYFY